MDSEAKMGDVTQRAYNFIEEDLLIMNEELDPDVVLDFLQDNDNFKKVSDLLKETMINARIPKDTKARINNYKSIEIFLRQIREDRINTSILNDSNSLDDFINSLLSLLLKQESECCCLKRKYSWNRPTIRRWFSDSTDDNLGNNSMSIRSREDAIAICFALGLDYATSREFMNKCGHAVFNIRDAEDAVYIYCLLNHRPLSVAKKLITYYYMYAEESVVSDYKEKQHYGDTTILLVNQIMGNSNWKNDDDFLNTFLLPNKANFISYSKTALREYYRLKNPIYLSALKTIIEYENEDYEESFDLRKIQERIHKANKDIPVTIPMSSVQVTYRFINNLKKYSTESTLLKEARDRLDIHVERRNNDGWAEEDFKTVNNSTDVIDYITSSIEKYSNNDVEQRAISDFLTETVTAYKMLCIWLPSVVLDDEDGKEYEKEYINSDGCVIKETKTKDTRQRSYNQSTLKDSVLSSFPHRSFFTLFERHPEKLVHDMSIRKTIILLFYMNYSRSLIQDISNPNSSVETEFGFENFRSELNEVLGNSQLGKLYPANQFDWLILESIKKLENYYDDDDVTITPISFLDKVLSLSFDVLSEIDDNQSLLTP